MPARPLATVLRSARLPFLILTPVCVLLGAAAALAGQAPVAVERLWLILCGALLAHVGVNLLNEYDDFASGLDLHTDKTPFSGGSGALPEQPGMAATVGLLGGLSVAGVVAIGLYFVAVLGMGILPLGLIGVGLIIGYTRYINRYPLICLIAPGTGFGLLMVVGSAYALTSTYTFTATLAGLVAFFLANNLLLLNQFPDIDADRAAGRNHLPIAYGTRIASFVYAAGGAGAVVTVVAGIAFGLFPPRSLVALAPALLMIYAFVGALRLGAEIGGEPRYLAANVAATVLTPLLLALSLLDV